YIHSLYKFSKALEVTITTTFKLYILHFSIYYVKCYFSRTYTICDILIHICFTLFYIIGMSIIILIEVDIKPIRYTGIILLICFISIRGTVRIIWEDKL